jgi:protein-tyrosine phosphatase
VIDIHTHLLPGVDDGSPTPEVSVEVLRRFAEQGVEVVVCTPHLDASKAGSVKYEDYQRAFEALVRVAPAAPELRLGWEIMLDVPGADLRAKYLSLGGSTAVLVEFPRVGIPTRALEEIWRLRMSGIVPVIAHPERYFGCTTAIVKRWKDSGAVIQTDSQMLLGGGPMSRLAQDMLQEGLVDVIASDNHGDRRSLASARQWLIDVGAPEQAEQLTRLNAGRLLGGLPPVPVAPVRIDRSMLGRLRELVFGRRTSRA